MKLKSSIQTIACAILCISLFSCEGNNSQGMGGFAREYAVMTLQPSSMEWYTSYPARIKGKQDIEIRPNVSGFLTELLVDEGSLVKKGDVLFVVDTIPYKAALKIAEATVESAKATAETARLTAENKRVLQQKGIISEYDLQMAENDYASALAQLALSEAQLVNARNNDSYTRVTSPLSGIVGSIPYRVGSLVSSAMATPLTTVSDNSEMYVYFSMTENQLLNLTRQYGSIANTLKNMPDVRLVLNDGSVYDRTGRIESISGVIDTSTGSVQLRAVFPNADGLLHSGGAGSVIVPNIHKDCVVVPQVATFELQNKVYVYKVEDGKATSSMIDVEKINNGREYIVKSGLTPGDVIVAEGVGLLREGTPIVVKGQGAAAQTAPEAATQTEKEE